MQPVMKDISEILLSGRTCVLATTGQGTPHTSLMAYVAEPDCRTLYLITPRRTRKYRNLMENPEVSILIDTRCDDLPEDVRALTVSGGAAEITESDTVTAVRKRFMDRHPELAGFFDAPGSAFVAVSIRSFQLLKGVGEASFLRLDGSG